MVLMTLMLALMKVYFSLLYARWRIWIPKSVIKCWLKCKNRNWIWFMRKCSYFRANGCIFALLVAISRKWLRIFSQWTAKGVLSTYKSARDKHNHKGQNHCTCHGTPLFPPLYDFGLDSCYKFFGANTSIVKIWYFCTCVSYPLFMLMPITPVDILVL